MTLSGRSLATGPTHFDGPTDQYLVDRYHVLRCASDAAMPQIEREDEATRILTELGYRPDNPLRGGREAIRKSA